LVQSRAVLLLLFIVWLVLLLALGAWAGLRGWRLWKAARAAQTEVETRLEASKLEELPGRIEELEQRQQVLAESLERLQRSVAEFAVLWNAASGVRRQVVDLRGFFTK
jgi:hypothetical protein